MMKNYNKPEAELLNGNPDVDVIRTSLERMIQKAIGIGNEWIVSKTNVLNRSDDQ